MIEGTCHCGACRWTLEGDPGPITACNCTLCRRYGALWAYDFVDGRIATHGPFRIYRRADRERPHLEYLTCPTCAGVLAARWLFREEDGRTRIAVNVRMTDPAHVAHLPIDHFDGLDTFEDLPRDGRTVKEMWF